MVVVNGTKFPIQEGVEKIIEGTGCSVLFAYLMLTATLPQFAVHYDGLSSAHIEMVTSPGEVTVRVGLCFDEEDKGRIISNHLQVSQVPECLKKPGPREFCGKETEYCTALIPCDSALALACKEMFCSTDPSSEQL